MFRASLILLCAFIAGCSQTPITKIRYYMFDAPPSSLQRHAEDTRQLLRINPVVLRGALNNRSIIMRMSPQRTHAANYHQWSESPSDFLTASCEQQLLADLDTWLVVKSSALVTDKLQQAYYQLDIELQRFNGGPQNDAELAGIWRLSHFSPDKGQKILLLKSFNLNEPLKKNGYEGLVEALGEGWRELNDEIASSLQQVNAGQ